MKVERNKENVQGQNEKNKTKQLEDNIIKDVRNIFRLKTKR